MMRYQRVSPDCLPLTNGRKHSLRTCKDDGIDDGGRVPNYPPFDGKAPRARSGSGSANPSAATHQENHFPHISFLSHSAKPANPIASATVAVAVTGGGSSPVLKTQNHHHDVNGVCSGGGGDVLLQWGHKKRSRGSRAESRAAAAPAAATAGENSPAHSRQMIKVSRRSAAAAAAAAAMPPPPCGSYSRGANLRPCTPIRDAAGSLLRGVEERSSGTPRSEKRSPPSPPEKAHSKSAAVNGDASMNPGSKPPLSDPEAAPGAGEKLNLEQFEWPRIYVSLSRKEKEDDFLAMKGTKLPQRPKKRAKNIDKTLQFCFPGMWLSDLTRGRYEVREKKCVKKKRRGLKGMESMDSDSE